MFDFIMYLLAGGALFVLAMLGLGVVVLPVYLVVRWYDAATAPSAEERAEIEHLLSKP